MLPRSQFFRANLQDALLPKADLEDAQLELSILKDTNLTEANLRNTRLSDANLEKANLYRANLQGSNLLRANLRQAIAQQANFQGANLDEADLERADLSLATLSEVQLRGTQLAYTTLVKADLQNARLYQANLYEANLQEAQLEGASISTSRLQNANFQNANLRDAVLPSAFMPNANLYKANLFNANMVGANLQHANLQSTDLRVDFRDLMEQLADWIAEGINALFIYADVVRFPDNYMSDRLDIYIQIAARRIEVGIGSNIWLDYRTTQQATFRIFTNEILGYLKVVAEFEEADKSKTYILRDFEDNRQKGVTIFCTSGGESRQIPIYWLDDLTIGDNPDFYLSLGAIFQFATLFFDRNPALATSMLEWTKGSTGEWDRAIDMFLQSSSLLAMLQTASEDVTFVPFLSRDIYARQAEVFVRAAAAYEEQYIRLSDINQDINLRQAEQELQRLYAQDKAVFLDRLIIQNRQNLLQAQVAVEVLQKKLDRQTLRVDLAQIDFKHGLLEWEYDQKKQQAFKIITAIFDFGLAIGGLFIGDPTAGLRAGNAAKSAAEAGSRLGGIMSNIKDITEALYTVYDFSLTVEEASKDLEESKSLIRELNQIEFSYPDDENWDLVASVYWPQFQLEATSQLQDPIDLGISGAREYLLALDILVLYGQSLAEKKRDMIPISQEIAQLRLQKLAVELQDERIWDYVQELEDYERANAEMMQVFYDRYLNIKRWLFITVGNYTWAYHFWSLHDSLIQPSMTKSVAYLKDDLAKIELDYENALERFKPKVPTELDGKTYEIISSEDLKSFQETTRVTVPILLADPAFSNYDRVRIKEIRVWLEGVTFHGSNKAVYLKIQTQGENYDDRFEENDYHFTGEPLDLPFEYQVAEESDPTPPPKDIDWYFDDGSVGTAIVRNNTVNEFQYAYFEPPVFTYWTLVFESSRNPDADITGVSKITLQFYGSIIGQ
ncbi:hypothetical protein CYANOKiyG1_72390 [Okeania sp. KiyG1]|nr:hypothetical protein CYANOKiyG1_72390 [Okeania sp. KiyG1]